MGVEAVLRHLDLGHGDVAAMVADALVVGEQVFKHKAVFDGAAARLQTGHMPRLDGTHQLIHNGLHGFDFPSKVQVVFAEGVGGAAQHILHRTFQHLQLLAGVLGKFNILGVDFLGRAQQIHGVIADALEIADGVEQGVHALAVGVAQLPAGQLDEVGAEGILVLVHLLLLIPDLLGEGVIPRMSQAHGLNDADAG